MSCQERKGVNKGVWANLQRRQAKRGQQTDLNHHDRLLHDVTDPRRNQVKEDVDTALGGALNLDRTLSNRPNRLADKIDVDLGGVPA